jgi:hypothetical protein
MTLTNRNPAALDSADRARNVFSLAASNSSDDTAPGTQIQDRRADWLDGLLTPVAAVAPVYEIDGGVA